MDNVQNAILQERLYSLIEYKLMHVNEHNLQLQNSTNKSKMVNKKFHPEP
jgi:hypothetical protein